MLLRALLFNYSMFIFLQETQISFDLYAAVICVALKQNKHASELPLLGKNIPKDHDGIFPPVLPTSISVPPIDINLALFPSGNCVIFSIFLDNRLLFYAVDHPCILAAVSNIQFGSIACTEYSNHYSISVSHYNSFSIYRNSFSTHSNIFDDRESELYVSFISKRSNVSVWERVTILVRQSC